MARRTTTKKKDAEPRGGAELALSPSRARRLEVLGVLLLVTTAALLFALFSFDPTDPQGRANLVGPVGARLARLLVGGIGALGYVVTGVFGLVAGAVFVGRARWPSPLALASALGVLLATCVLAHLVGGGDFVLGQPAGGVVGEALGDRLRAWIGPAGAGLFAVGVLMVSLIGLADVSFAAAARDTGAVLSWAGRRVKGEVEVWREAQTVARETESALVEKAEAKRKAADQKREAREQRLREKLEEKKKTAVLRAAARAEERALKKIASAEAKARVERALAESPAPLPTEAAPAPRPSRPLTRDAPPAVDDAGQVVVPPWALEDAPPSDLELPGPAAEPEVGSLDEDLEDAWFEDAPDATPEADEAPAEPAPVALEAESAAEVEPAATVAEAAPAPAEAEAAPSELPWADAPTEVEIAGSGPRRPVFDLEDADDSPDEDASDEARPSAPAATPRRVKARVEAGPRIIEARARKPDPESLDDEALHIDLGHGEPREYDLPPLKLLDYDGAPPAEIDPLDLRSKATRLEDKLKTYGVDGKVTAIRPGPVVTTYEYQPAPGVKVAKIAGLSDDIAMSMEATSVRIIAPIPGRGVVGIELPSERRETVWLKEIIAHESFQRSKGLLTIAVGKDAEGEAQVANLAKMPHLLVAGTTGSGKSVCTNAMILSVLYKASPDQVKFIMVDPKMLELSLYEGIPHLLLPVVTDPKKASLALQWAVDEMERRYKLLSSFKVRNIDGFNHKLGLLRKQRAAEAARRAAEAAEAERASQPPVEAEAEPVGLPTESDPDEGIELVPEGKRIDDLWVGEEIPKDLPFIVVLIDEFADLMCVAPRDVEGAVQRLAQKARASGIHLIIATQRPSTDVITGVIKNNLPTRMSFRVASRHDSATIINQPGAENLLGMGDMLYLSNATPTPVRVHGAYVSEEEVQRVVEFWKAQGSPSYDEAILKPRDADGEGGVDEDADEMYDEAVRVVTETQKASISALQRRLRVGYNRAARMIEMMEREGIVSEAMGPKGEREVLVREMSPDGPPRV